MAVVTKTFRNPENSFLLIVNLVEENTYRLQAIFGVPAKCIQVFDFQKVAYRSPNNTYLRICVSSPAFKFQVLINTFKR